MCCLLDQKLFEKVKEIGGSCKRKNVIQNIVDKNQRLIRSREEEKDRWIEYITELFEAERNRKECYNDQTNAEAKKIYRY